MEESHESHGRVPSSRLSGDELLSIRSVWISKKKVRVSVEEASGVLEETEYQIRRRYQSKKAFCYLPQSRHAIRAFFVRSSTLFLIAATGLVGAISKRKKSHIGLLLCERKKMISRLSYNSTNACGYLHYRKQPHSEGPPLNEFGSSHTERCTHI